MRRRFTFTLGALALGWMAGSANAADPKPMPKFPMTPPLPDTAPGLRDAGKVVHP